MPPGLPLVISSHRLRHSQAPPYPSRGSAIRPHPPDRPALRQQDSRRPHLDRRFHLHYLRRPLSHDEPPDARLTELHRIDACRQAFSFTVDPAHDTPPVLAKYAQFFKADPARWHFLTGDRARLNDLGLNGFKLNVVDGSLSHSTRFALVDGRRRIRGFYLTSEDDFKSRLLHDLHQLEREK